MAILRNVEIHRQLAACEVPSYMEVSQRAVHSGVRLFRQELDPAIQWVSTTTRIPF